MAAYMTADMPPRANPCVLTPWPPPWATTKKAPKTTQEKPATLACVSLSEKSNGERAMTMTGPQ